MMKFSKINRLMVSVVFLMAIILIQGCGRTETAPDGSTIIFNPASHSQAGISAPTCVTFDVIVRYPDKTPFPKAIVTIYGPFAEPRNASNQSPRYQFYLYENCNMNASNIPVASGFQVQTDDNGKHTFSALIYDVVNGTTNIFSDTIEAHSGTAFGSATIEVTQ